MSTISAKKCTNTKNGLFSQDLSSCSGYNNEEQRTTNKGNVTKSTLKILQFNIAGATRKKVRVLEVLTGGYSTDIIYIFEH